MRRKKNASDSYHLTEMESASSNDVDSLDVVVEQYEGLVRRIAFHLHGKMPSHVNVDDLIQSGMIGLIDAACKYDDSKGASFETYASIRIRGSILDEIRRGDWAPRSVYKNSRRVTEAIRSVENRLGRDAKDAEIAEEMNITLDEYNAILKDLAGVRLFNVSELAGSDEADNTSMSYAGTGPSVQAASVSEESVMVLSKSQEPHRETEEAFLVEAIAGAIEEIPERECQILSLYYNDELNLKEIGEIFGLSESRVSQIHAQAIHRLRSKLPEW